MAKKIVLRKTGQELVRTVREMDKDEVSKTPEGQPTIDHIDIAEFESPDEQREWLNQHAPAFVRVRE